ncbi:triphosphoribosyl-dephospho-CoA synthase [Methylovorus glucosotrophus]|uniref:triphosphoribosyl-dephospho-CoA synthase n=1 Tax=Methylovorus glucosotrophus TaxID=266009 RepID=UPI0013314AFD|nr:triphosphoribosyl-dephospho-CoA synthase [Methylovorus glucosotrophus]KAF0843867.1 triphosphoribosyl-dephospho-CoA synthase [Methylovorus glucosotrophus]
MTISASELAGLYKEACLAELSALKPGNVHIFADGHGMVVQDFIASAEASAQPLCEPGLTVGQRIQQAIQATWSAVNCNTNLGIILLAAPMIQASLEAGLPLSAHALSHTLQSLTVDDARLAYAAILQASPAGLGSSDQHDVHEAPAVTLLQAMEQAQSYDLVARQYANGYQEIVQFGLGRYHTAMARWQREAWAVSAVYLGFLSRYPDSHIARKYGLAAAERVMQQALVHEQNLMASDNPKTCQRSLMTFDQELKTAKLNPGTTADLTVATVLAAALFTS